MHRKRIVTARYLAALAITIVIFLLGFLLGGFTSEQKLQRVYDLEHDIRVESLGNELLLTLITSDLCTNINFTTYTSELRSLAQKLTYMESLYGFDAPQVKNLKNYYTLLMIRHWIIMERANAECGFNRPSVLYFYTNYGCEDCEDQGLVLSAVHRDNPVFNTYSFEYELDNPALRFLKERYHISADRLPTLVINGETVYGFQTREAIEERLKLARSAAP